MQTSNLSLRTGIYPSIDPANFQDSLKGKVAVVTGSSRGIGRHIAHALAHAGAAVVITGRDETNVDETVKEVSVYGTKTIGIVANVLSRKDMENLVQATTRRLGPIDILVLNAGTNTFMPFHLTSADSWWDIMKLNVKSPVELTRLVLPSMQKRNTGTIIFTSSRAATANLPWTTAYNCSKSSVTKFAGTLQAELETIQIVEGGFKNNGIECFSFHPGEIDTDLHETAFPENLKTEAPYVLDHMRKIGAKRPRFSPELPAWTVVFLASGKARSLRGAYVDSTRDIGEAIDEAEKKCVSIP